MGKIFSSIFGGSGSKQKSQSNSQNQSYGYIKDTFSPLTEYATSGANALNALLSGDTTGFDAYKKATGFDAVAESGARGVTADAAARGLLRSGGTGSRYQIVGNNVQNQFANSYMDRLLAQAGLGFNAGNLISGAGNVSNSSSSGSSYSKPGMGKFIGSILSGGAG